MHAVAQGKIETAGHSKVIEPLDPGKMAAIHVEAGQPVRAGDLLLRTRPGGGERGCARRGGRARRRPRRDRPPTLRHRGGPSRETEDEEARARRRLGTQSPPRRPAPSRQPFPYAVEALAGRPDLAIAWDEATPESFRLREEAVLRADLTQLSDALKALDRQMAQKLATRKRLDMSIAFQRTLMDTLNQRVATRQEAIDKQVGTKINLYDAKEELEKSQSQLASDEGQLIETDAALKELQSEKDEDRLAVHRRQSEQARRGLAQGRRGAPGARQVRRRLERAHQAHAPIDGVVQQTAVTTIGQVVTTGQQLAVITPNGGKLQVEALVANLDIGFVKLGQPAVVKVDAFPFTRFGVLHGKVVKIASAAIPEEEAKRALANAAAAANPAQTPSTAPGQAESFVFPVTVALDETAMKIDNAIIPLAPGMTVTVEIKTDSRRVIDYLLSPLAKLASEAARER